ncbi:MAG: hypothetical protein EOO62_20815, partial [Hymenobacter sp.]
MRYSYTGGALALTAPTTDLQAVVAPGGSAFRADVQATINHQQVAAHYGFGIQLDLPGHLAAYATTRQLLGQLQGAGWEAGLGYARNLRPHGRPLLARAGLGYLRQSSGRRLGTVPNPDADLRLAGTPLAADQLTLSLQRVTSALQPKLGLGLEISHHWEAVADLGYLLSLGTHNQLLIEEKGGFFSFNQQAAELALPAAEAQVFVRNQPAAAGPWQLGHLLLSVGVLY